MKTKMFLTAIFALLMLGVSANAQTAKPAKTQTNSNTTKASANTAQNDTPKRPAIFRANKDQIMQAQKILKDKGLYKGEQTGKMDTDFRAGLKKFQADQKIKATGTLNKVTLEGLGITLTDKQKAM